MKYLVLVLLVVGCVEEAEEAPRVCVPGEVRACQVELGYGSRPGSQTCPPSGAGFSDCTLLLAIEGGRCDTLGCCAFFEAACGTAGCCDSYTSMCIDGWECVPND